MDAKLLKQHKCKYCKKLFARPSDLRRHSRIHTNEKAFKCDICGKAFNVSGNLLVHKRIHEGVKPYKCNTCKKSFTQKCSLIRHKRRHSGETPFACDKCNKAFSNPYNLVCHKRTHTGLRPYKCETCGKTFSQCGGLIAHKRTHTGEKHFKCDTCDRNYSQASSLAKHIKRHIHVDETFSSSVSSKQFSKASRLLKNKQSNTHKKQVACPNIAKYQIKAVSPTKSLLGHKRKKCTRINMLKFDILVKLSKKSYRDLHNKQKQLTNEKRFESPEVLTSSRDEFSGQISNDDVSSGQETQFDHEPEAQNESCGDQIDQSAPCISEEALYQCRSRESTFSSSELLISHKEVHISQEQENPVHDVHDEGTLTHEESLTNQTFQVTPVISGKEVYQCDSCCRTFNSSDLLILHKEKLHAAQQVNSGLCEQLKCFIDEDSNAIDTDQMPLELVMSSESTEHQLSSLKELDATRQQSDSEIESNEEGCNNREDERQTAETLERLDQADENFVSTEITASYKNESHNRQQQQNQLGAEHETNSELFGTAISNERETNMSPEFFSTDTVLTTQEQETEMLNEDEANKEPYTIPSVQKETEVRNGEPSSQTNFCEPELSVSKLLTLHEEELLALQAVGVLSDQLSDFDLDYNIVDSCHDESFGAETSHTDPTNLNMKVQGYQLGTRPSCEVNQPSVDEKIDQTRVGTSNDELTCDGLHTSTQEQQHQFVFELEVRKESYSRETGEKALTVNSTESREKRDVLFQEHAEYHFCGTLIMEQDMYKCKLCERNVISADLSASHEDETHIALQENNLLELGSKDESFHSTTDQVHVISSVTANQCRLAEKEFVPTGPLTSCEEDSQTTHQVKDSFDEFGEELQDRFESDESCSCETEEVSLSPIQEYSYQEDMSSALPKEDSRVKKELGNLKSYKLLECRLDIEFEAVEKLLSRTHQHKPTRTEEEAQCDHFLCKKAFPLPECFTSNVGEFLIENQICDIVSSDVVSEINHLNLDYDHNFATGGTCKMLSERRSPDKPKHINKHVRDVVSDQQLESFANHTGQASPQKGAEEFDLRMEEVTEKIHECDLCERAFVTQHLLTLHTGERLHNGMLSQEFQYNLDVELEATKPLGITYICAHCGEEFKLADELLRHTEVAHAI